MPFFFPFLHSNQIKLEPSESDGGDVLSTQKRKKHRTEAKRGATDKHELGFEPDQILGANKIDGQIIFRIKVKDSEEWEIVNAKNAHVACPGLVIDFYEKHCVLEGEPLYRNK